MKKLRSARGETLVETLTALLVATLVLLFLSTSIAVASRINRQVRDADTSFRYPTEVATRAHFFDLTISDPDGFQTETIHVYEFQDDSGQYRYYRGGELQ